MPRRAFSWALLRVRAGASPVFEAARAPATAGLAWPITFRSRLGQAAAADLDRRRSRSRRPGEALLVNPLSREDVAEAIHRALTMPKAERIARWTTLMAGVVNEDVSAWRDNFVSALTRNRPEIHPEA